MPKVLQENYKILQSWSPTTLKLQWNGVDQNVPQKPTSFHRSVLNFFGVATLFHCYVNFVQHYETVGFGVATAVTED